MVGLFSKFVHLENRLISRLFSFFFLTIYYSFLLFLILFFVFLYPLGYPLALASYPLALANIIRHTFGVAYYLQQAICIPLGVSLDGHKE